MFLSAGAARVLITSTEQSVAGLGTPVPVDMFSDEEALAFLGERTGLGSAGAEVVVTELGHLPLALAQAAAVITGHQMGYGTYMERLRTPPVAEYLTQEVKAALPAGRRGCGAVVPERGPGVRSDRRMHRGDADLGGAVAEWGPP